MKRIQTYLVEPGNAKKILQDFGPVDYPQIPLETQSFTLGGDKRYIRRMIHLQPPPMILYIEELSEAH